MTFFLSDNRGTLEEREEHAEEQEEEEERERKKTTRERERSSRCCCYRGCGAFKKARTDDPRDVGRDRCCLLARGYFLFTRVRARIFYAFFLTKIVQRKPSSHVFTRE